MIDVFKNGVDVGYRDNQNWWNDGPESFRIAKLDEDYPAEYFATDHVSGKTVSNYCNNVIRGFEMMAGRRLKSIIEFGSGGGWFTAEFLKRGYSIVGYEGSGGGVDRCLQKMMPVVRWDDFRILLPAPSFTKYDIALCTEVAEHIEPPFSSMLVQNLTSHSDMIWWSSEEPNTNKPHLHHPNEQPYQYWINLFEFYGYGAALLSDEIYNSCEGRGRYIFYNKKVYDEKP